MQKLNAMDWIAMALVIVGGINWGLVGALQFNLVEFIFGAGIVASVIYSLVGLGALYETYTATELTG